MVWKEPGKDKDPWGGSGQGSPDLEKLVDDLHKRFSSFFGRRRRGRGRNHALLWSIPLAVSVWLLTGCYVVDTGDRGVDFLLGRFQSVTTAGLHWHVPWPLGADQTVSAVDQGADYLRGYAVLPTVDGNAVSVEVSVHYRITDLPQYLFANASPAGGSAAADVIGNLTDGAVSAAVVHAPLSALMGPGVDAVENAVRDQLVAGLKRYPVGIEVSRVTLAKVSAPAPVGAAYAAVRQAQIVAKQQSDAADAYAAEALPRARVTADSRVEAAKDDAAELVKRAEGDAAAFSDVLVAYRRAPAVTRETLYLSTYEQILSQVDRVVVMSKDGHVTLSMEHDAVVAKAPATAQASVPASVPKPVPKPPAKGAGGQP